SGAKIKKAYLFEIFIICLTFILSAFLAFQKLAYYPAPIVKEFTWINLGNTPLLGVIKVNLGILVDNLSVIMMAVVALISMLVHFFSLAYMKDDIRYNRYFAYLGIFTFSMSGIVLAHNILMMYIFWELVGISSYMLIGFWFEKKSASDAAKKAFLVNRVGDIGMFAGILILFTNYKTFTFSEIFHQISIGHLPFSSEFWLTVAGLLIFCGAVGKSAQFPLHVWLPDAMEGPTPVSALIHAATMVAAGVYLVVRVYPILSGDALFIIACIGALSAFIPATIALTQNDIKKVLAYSTISQLGYMIMALGVGAYQFAFFHLVTHAFFKACLFLGSGSVIYAMHHEQDMRQMGGLKKKMPWTYATFLISTLAISGIPLTSGFLSKDGILAGTFAFGNLTGNYIFMITGFLVAMLTAFYMFRVVLLTFHGEPRNQVKFDHAKESPLVMVLPLVVLSILSIFFFYTFNPINANQGWVLSKWVHTPEISVPNSSRYEFFRNENTVPEVKSELNGTEVNKNGEIAFTENILKQCIMLITLL
ncbi:MAG: NADH-quinone oxidoreductase subunit L, partial [Bacteroidota bacterium]|nr:NADH-quinone oxidoreductase subunit L [Bacteroidota bacterium]